jgi:hypothetical protein
MERMWAASHPSQKAIPRSSQACPEPEQRDGTDNGQTFGVFLLSVCIAKYISSQALW